MKIVLSGKARRITSSEQQVLLLASLDNLLLFRGDLLLFRGDLLLFRGDLLLFRGDLLQFRGDLLIDEIDFGFGFVGSFFIFQEP